MSRPKRGLSLVLLLVGSLLLSACRKEPEGVTVRFWAMGREAEVVAAINAEHRNPAFLPGALLSASLTATGAPPTSILLKGYWPQVSPAFWSVALLRWDINIRESAVLGLVGGGGIGVALDSALSNLYWDQVGLILFVIFVVVLLTEVVTSFIRSKII